jgi:hypothetical protein
MALDTEKGHRQRLRERFVAGEQKAQSDEALLELLLCYAIPQRDVHPLARLLIAKYGSLSAVLGASPDSLCRVEGLKDHSATLLKLVDHIRSRQTASDHPPAPRITEQATLFEPPAPSPDVRRGSAKPKPEKTPPARAGLLFGKAVLKEAISVLPSLPDTDSLDSMREFVRDHLHFSGEETRRRSASYIVRRLFPDGRPDPALIEFARAHADSQELRDVAFYRFCKAEPLMLRVASDLLLPSIGTGKVTRSRLREFLAAQFPNQGGLLDCGQAIADALTAAGVARSERTSLTFAYREIPLDSFAFLLHSEFPEPGMYDISKLQSNPYIQTMLWNPDRVLPALYELRNRGVLPKISEIDNIRQFTTKCDLVEAVRRVVGARQSA